MNTGQLIDYFKLPGGDFKKFLIKNHENHQVASKNELKDKAVELGFAFFVPSETDKGDPQKPSPFCAATREFKKEKLMGIFEDEGEWLKKAIEIVKKIGFLEGVSNKLYSKDASIAALQEKLSEIRISSNYIDAATVVEKQWLAKTKFKNNNNEITINIDVINNIGLPYGYMVIYECILFFQRNFKEFFIDKSLDETKYVTVHCHSNVFMYLTTELIVKTILLGKFSDDVSIKNELLKHIVE